MYVTYIYPTQHSDTTIFIQTSHIHLFNFTFKNGKHDGQGKEIVADKVAHIKKPEVELTDVDLKGVSRSSADFKSQISVTNPYDHSIPIYDITYTLKCANRDIASGKIPDPGSIKENCVTLLDMDMKVPYSVLVNLAKDIGADWDIDYDLNVSFTVDFPILGNFTIPLNKKGQFKLPTLSDIF